MLKNMSHVYINNLCSAGNTIVSLFPGTIAEGAPVVPISAQLKYNIEVICEYICKKIPIPLRDFTSHPRLIGEWSVNTYEVSSWSLFVCLVQ